MNERSKRRRSSSAKGESPRTTTDFRIVGIGASAGGLQAISALLHALPKNVELALVVVVHLDPTHPSSLAELLANACKLPVEQAVDGQEVVPGHVYVIPPNTAMKVRDGCLRLTPRTLPSKPQRPIDGFLESLAREYGARGIGVVLSGTGSDGTAGLQALEAAGGLTFAQDKTAEHGDMPASAIAADCVDAVLPPAGIARELAAISLDSTHWPSAAAQPVTEDEEGNEEALTRIVRRLSRATGIDFVHYKQKTVRRRIQRRITMLGLGDALAYEAYFGENPEEAKALCREILIHVTGFFRDPEVFRILSEQVFPAIVKDRAEDDPIRIWMAGCASGEEVYSIAISLLEFLEQEDLEFPVKLFGTDVSKEAVALARAGHYPKRIASEISPERLRNYFRKESDGYVVSKAVRDLCVFARQDATRDPPFSNLDLISCRNLLIYLGPTLQKRVLPVFHYALREGGFLLLGTAEGVGTMDDLFAQFDDGHSLYSRRSVPRRLPIDLGLSSRPEGHSTPPVGFTVSGFDVQREADRILLAKYAPVGVLVDEDLQVLHFRGDTGTFLAPAPGTPSNNLLRMAREGLLPDLKSILEEGIEHGLPVRREGLRIKSEGREVRANLELTPVRIPGTAERCYTIQFETVDESAPETAERVSVSAPASPADSDERVTHLERELVATRDFLRASVERLEVTNQELRAANEEILSSNEELQSTNEELQTAKEELQATNEELQTTNEELRHRNKEVAMLGSDLFNVLASVKLPVVMLGRDLRVRRFTPSVAKLLGTRVEIGSPLVASPPEIFGPELEGFVLEVLDTLAPAEREVRDAQGLWFSLSVHPYRTQDDRVDGAVLTWTDIDGLKRLAQALERARDFTQTIVMSVQVPLLVLDADLTVLLGNRAFYETFRTSPKEVEKRALRGMDQATWVTPELLERFATVAEQDTGFSGLAIESEIPGRGQRHLRLGAQVIAGEGNGERLVLLSLEDVTDEELARGENERLTRKLLEAQRLESLGVLAGGIAHDFNNILVAVLGFAELIRTELSPESSAFQHTEKVIHNARRASDLCDEMLAYSGKGRFQIRPIELSRLVEDSRTLLEALVSKATRLHFELEPDLPVIEGDLAQLRQVLVNLALNASEALEEEGGVVTIRTGRMELGEAPTQKTSVGELSAGVYAYLEVTDTGCGMDPETQARIFDPFFTTKFTGRGLGLAAVMGIVRGHHGALQLDSQPRRGSSFRLLLPADRLVNAVPVVPAVLDKGHWKGDGQTVLIVDDESDVRSLLRAMLGHLELKVQEASGGQAGIAALSERGEHIDLVLLDVTMPGMSGALTFQRLHELHPDLPVVLMSGYDEAQTVSEFPATTLAGFLRKPFSMNDLVTILERSLSASTEPRQQPPDSLER